MKIDFDKISIIYGNETLSEIKERIDFIDSIGEQMVLDNGKFNSVFEMIKKRYAKK